MSVGLSIFETIYLMIYLLSSFRSIHSLKYLIYERFSLGLSDTCTSLTASGLLGKCQHSKCLICGGG